MIKSGYKVNDCAERLKTELDSLGCIHVCIGTFFIFIYNKFSFMKNINEMTKNTNEIIIIWWVYVFIKLKNNKNVKKHV